MREAEALVPWTATNAAPSVVSRPTYGSNGAMKRASIVEGGKKTAPWIGPTTRSARSERPASSPAVRKRAARHIGEPSQPRTRRRAAQTLHLPRSPMTSRPPGRSTRAICLMAVSASDTKVSTGPIGSTDSEVAFCILMDRLSALWSTDAPPSAAARLTVVADLAAEMRDFGPANFLSCPYPVSTGMTTIG
jgi:hypothetical protein